MTTATEADAIVKEQARRDLFTAAALTGLLAANLKAGAADDYDYSELIELAIDMGANVASMSEIVDQDE